jgi:hypothetical protein
VWLREVGAGFRSLSRSHAATIPPPAPSRWKPRGLPPVPGASGINCPATALFRDPDGSLINFFAPVTADAIKRYEQ